MRKHLFYVLFFCFLLSSLYSYDIELYHVDYHLDENLMRQIQKQCSTRCLVETGTWSGRTASLAAGLFEEVYTVEIHPGIFQEAEKTLKNKSNVHRYCDESSHFLQTIIGSVPKNTLFWLDAHYCGEGSGTVYLNETWVKSPLKDELTIILDHFDSRFVILVDDIRGYLNLPEHTRTGREYATVSELYALAKNHTPALSFYILGDMVIIYDPAVYPLTVSPFVEACTTSYVFNPFLPHTQSDVENVLRAESFLMSVEPTRILDQTIQNLCNYPLNPQDWSAFYPILWHGLRMMQKTEYHSALDNFGKLLSFAPGICHDRIYLYMAQCHQKLGHLQKSEELLLKVSDQTKKSAAVCNLIPRK